MKKRVTLKIIGLVQGIGFRYASQKEATKRELVGYVKNLADGSVEVVAEGKEEDLKKFITWCYNGVEPAMVQKINETWSASTSEFSVFAIR